MSLKLFNKDKDKRKFKETLPSAQMINDTKPSFFAHPQTNVVNESIEVIKEDVDERNTYKSISNIVIDNDSSPDDLLHAIKEGAKEDKRRWDRITINYIVNDNIRKQLKIDREGANKFVEEIEALYEFLSYVLGYGDEE